MENLYATQTNRTIWNNTSPYSYSGIKMYPEKMTHLLSEIQNRIHKVSNTIYNFNKPIS